jgi:hypothetical protein
MTCDCCNTARGFPEFRQFNPACKWCGARYLKAVKTVATGPQLDAWRASILETWEKHGHDRAQLRELAKPAGVPLAPGKG